MTAASSGSAEPRCVVITGGASGIGAACARRAAAEGAALALLDLNGPAVEALADEIGGGCLAIEVDATDEAAMNRAAERVAGSGLPPVDALVASAGLAQPPLAIEDFPLEEFERILASHIRSTYVAARIFGGAMAARGRGAAVFLASVLSFRPGPVLAYGAGKAAIVSLAQSLAVQWAGKGVRVNAVAPGWTDTPLLRAPQADGKPRDHSPILAATPQARLIEPEEIAEVIHFLLSPGASAVTGATLVADGGLMAAAGWGPYGGVPRQ